MQLKKQFEIAPIILLITATVILIVVNVPYLDGHSHNIGGDYSYFFPRWLGEYQWFRLNGYGSLPWFTPAFCGGMPDWGNPQSAPYSLPQWLVFFVDPSRAAQIAFAIYAAAGASGMWLLLRSGFRTSAWAALVGSVLFLFNGFFICRMIVGHPQFGVFMLFPWVTWLLMRRTLDAVIAGLLIGLMIHSAAVAILLPLGIAWIAVGLLRLTPGYFPRFALALGVGAVLSIGKLTAMSAFAAQFPRDFYALPGYLSVGKLLRAAIQALFWRVPEDSANDILYVVQSRGLQENEYSLSPVPAIIIAAWIFTHPRALLNGIRRWQTMALVLVLAIPFVLNLHISDGWMMFLKSIPIIRSTVSLFRWMAAYIPIIVIIAALAFDRLKIGPIHGPLAIAAIVGAIAFSLSTRRDVYNGFPYEPARVLTEWHTIHYTGEIKSIEFMQYRTNPDGTPAHLAMGDNLIALGADNVICYEPLFGYHSETLPWHSLHPGLALEESDGWLNVINPVCELYPRENNCQPGDRFKVTEKGAAESFLSWRPFPFRQPMKQRVADAISAIAFVVLGIGVTLGLMRRARVSRSSRATGAQS